MSVPSWVQDSIFYQIFPDRFANGHNGNNPKSVQPWNAKPTIYSFHGGDIKGIIDHMYYLLDLGINAIYLNPIFLSPSNHRYNAVDYFQIDPKLGNKLEFFTLLDVAHRNEMKVILDGVFNHCGRGFFAFNDVLENQANSPYTDWFHIKKFPVDAYSPGDATSYEGWWKYKSLPKFNTSNPEVEKYILKVARYWIEQGIDGWRLDVPNEINDDGFWLRFREVVRSANPDAYLVGEIWDGDPRWVGNEHFDGLMNYPLKDLIIYLLTNEISMDKFRLDLHKWQNMYADENSKAMYNLLGSHDVERFLTKIGGDIAKAKLGYLLLFTLIGAPAIYYGDEIGLLGGKDPDCRRTFNWDESQWMTPLRDWIKKLIRVRKEKVALRRGIFQLLETEPCKNCLAFVRLIDNECGLTLINIDNSALELTIDLSGTPLATYKSLRNVLATDEYVVMEQKITVKLPALSGALLFAY
ncbi:MAG: alpha-amylase [Anaerolinea sp.]|nr:alpha-amylase [Anaerolinea sp.]